MIEQWLNELRAACNKEWMYVSVELYIAKDEYRIVFFKQGQRHEGKGVTLDAAFQDALLDIERQKLKASWKTASAPRSRNIGDIFK